MSWCLYLAVSLRKGDGGPGTKSWNKLRRIRPCSSIVHRCFSLLFTASREAATLFVVAAAFDSLVYQRVPAFNSAVALLASSLLLLDKSPHFRLPFRMPTEAEEVAEDYRLALEDLSSNARFEISNLTVIARENTEHALLIAQALEQHILKVGSKPRCLSSSGIALVEISLAITNMFVDGPEQEAPRLIRSRFDRQEYRYPLYVIPRQESVQNVHGGIYSRRPGHKKENGRNAENMETACCRIYGHAASLLP